MVKFVHSVSDFRAELAAAGNKLVVVDFTATWCGPCRKIAPVFEKLAVEHTDVVFLKVDVDDAPDLSQECGISSMPTFQFYKNGTKVAEFSGCSEDKLRSTLLQNK